MASIFEPAMLPLETARWRLGTVWFAGAGLIISMLVIQSVAGVYEDRVQAVWSWVLPNLVPTLSLMVGVFAGAALQEEAESDRMRVRRAFYRLAIGLSVFHLTCVLVTLLVQPFIPALQGFEGQIDPRRSFEVSNLWLGPLQGLVAAVLGTLFFSKSGKKTRSRSR
jgi:hypothetical protein